MSAQEKMMINREEFFKQLKTVLFQRALGSKQREGFMAILDRWEALPIPGDLRHLAYVFATVHHETAQTMQPIKERGGESYLRKLYDITGSRPALARSNGNTTPGDGVRYAGRGFVQLTWKNNYKRASNKLGIDLVAAPDRALDIHITTDILFAGMAEGWFTGKKISDYLNEAKTDWINARRIINGLDKAELIANLAGLYFKALDQGGEQELFRQNTSSKRKVITQQRVKAPTVLRPQPQPARPARRSR
jgi:putative chitinase